MAGKHVGGSDTLAVARGDTAPFVELFMPKNDIAYAEGRLGAKLGGDATDNPHGVDVDAADLINQRDAWECWNNGFTAFAFGGFQEETAVVDDP